MDSSENLPARVAPPLGPRSKDEVDRLNELAWELVPVDIRRAAAIAGEAHALARGIEDEAGVTRCLVAEASRDFFMAAYEGALEKTRRAVERMTHAPDPTWEGRVKLIEGLVHWSKGDFESALEALHQSLELAEATAQPRLVGWALTSLGAVHDALGDLAQAIGLHARAYRTFEGAGYDLGRGRALSGLGNVLYRQGRLDAGLEQQLASLAIFRAVPSELSAARALNDLGSIHRARGAHGEARACLLEALRIRRHYGNLPAAITTTIDLGELHLAEGDARGAIDLLTEAASLAEQARAKPKLHLAHEALSRAYEKAGDCRRALRHQRRAQRVKEEVLSDEASARLRNLQIRYEVERAQKEAEIERLRNVELRDALDELTRAQAQIVQAEKMASLGRLVAGVAHEMNSPLGAMASSLDVSARVLSKLLTAEAPAAAGLERLKQDLSTASRAAARLGEIVKSLESFSRVDRSSFQRFDVHDGIESALALLASEWPARVELARRYGSLPEIEGYPGPLNEAVMTILRNAVEAIEGPGRVEVTTSVRGDSVRVIVSDTGRGIPREELPRIFDVGFTRKGGNVRMRTGLANVHATVVLLHGGSVDVRSVPGAGTTFEIALPVRPPVTARLDRERLAKPT